MPTKTNKLPQSDLHKTWNGILNVSSSTCCSHGHNRKQAALKERNNQHEDFRSVKEIGASLLLTLTLIIELNLFHPWISGCNCSSLQAQVISWLHCPFDYMPHTQSTKQVNIYDILSEQQFLMRQTVLPGVFLKLKTE